MADPSYGGVRISKNITATDNEILVDFATYIYGNVIAAATTIRSMPLLADWSELLVHWVDEYKVKEWSDDKRKKLKKEIRMIHLQYKADLVHLSNELMKETLKRPKNEWAPYLNPATQASSIAV
jgi:endonuclease I